MNVQRLLAVFLFVGLASQAHAQGTPTIRREPAQSTAPDSGSEMFTAYCAVCHGPDGKGKGPAAPALKKEPANLTQLSKKNGGQFPAIKVSLFIKGNDVVAAHGSRDMPIWGRIFWEMDGERIANLRIHNLTTYIESLQEK